MGQILSGLGGQYGGGSQYGGGGYGGRRSMGGNDTGGRGYRGGGNAGGVNGPNGNWPGYYLGGGGALPNSGPTSDRLNSYPYGFNGGGGNSGSMSGGGGADDPRAAGLRRQENTPWDGEYHSYTGPRPTGGGWDLPGGGGGYDPYANDPMNKFRRDMMPSGTGGGAKQPLLNPSGPLKSSGTWGGGGDGWDLEQLPGHGNGMGGGGSPASDPLGSPLGGGVEATPDPLGPMTMTKEGDKAYGTGGIQNPMRKPRGGYLGTGDPKYRS